MAFKNGKEIFELKSVENSNYNYCFLMTKERAVVGNSESCDIIIPHENVSPIHSVIEIKGDSFKIFDMNSDGGTFLNGEKIVVGNIKIGDNISFSSFDFVFKKYEKIDLPPLLDMIDPFREEVPPAIDLPLEKQQDKIPIKKKGKFQKIIFKKEKEIKKVKFPLDLDSKASFSEYIFEDSNDLLPIFNYENKRASIEVSILHKNEILSIDYLDTSFKKHYLKGRVQGNKNEIEFPILSRNHRHCLIEKKRGENFINKISGFKFFHLSNLKTDDTSSENIKLGGTDIVRIYKGDIQIFLRYSNAPPQVSSAPIFSKDNELIKINFFVFSLLFFLFIAIGNVKIDRELKKEKIPKLIATILYKPKPKPEPVKEEKIHKVGVEEVKKPVEVLKEKPKEIPPVRVEQPAPKKIPKKELKKVSNNQIVEKPKKVKKVVSPKPKKIKKGKASSKNKVVKKKKIVNPSPKKSKKVKFKKAVSKTKKIRKSRGRLKVYDATSFNFDSTVNKLLAKGGSTKVAKVRKNKIGGAGLTGIKSTGQESKVKGRQLVDEIGDLDGNETGVLDTGEGLEGLSTKKGISIPRFPSKTVILGNYDPSLIRKILKDHVPQFRHCYQKILERKSRTFNGIVAFRFKIGASGRVKNPGVSNEESRIPARVKVCVLNILRGIKFPPPKGGGVVGVNQRLNFQGKDLLR